jgi:hypothetical protein
MMPVEGFGLTTSLGEKAAIAMLQSSKGGHGMRTFWLLLFFLGRIALAEEPPKTMIRIVGRLQSHDLPQESFAAQPKVIYRAGTRYCRTEELPDRVLGIHGLMIINEPDVWMINLFAKAGKHYLDHGPTFDCRMPIFIDADKVKSADDLTNPLYELEFGQELAYFKRKGALRQEGPVLQGKPTNAYVVTVGDWQFILFTNGQPERPISVTRDRAKYRETVWYGAYEELPFDPKLFAVPEGMKIEDAKSVTSEVP